MPLTLSLLLAVAAAAAPTTTSGGAPDGSATVRPGFFRHPALRGGTLVFAAEGDLWRVGIEGGRASRLTSHPGEESHPRLSPNGRTLAYTARYEGPAEVYSMPVDGGLPRRRTWEAEDSIATTWTPSGELVYATEAESTLPDPQLVALGDGTGERRVIPLSQASEGSFDATGRTLYFVRPAFHRNVTKRYTGGTARRIWRFAEGDAEAVCLTPDYEGESHSPLWWNGRVYFVSDRDGTMNLWSMDERGGDLRQHTRHSGWDVRRPALDAGRIVYELGADLRLLDLASGDDHVVPIELVSDFDQLREKWVKEPLQYLTAAHVHPKGESVVLTARGRVFVVPVGPGRLVRNVRDEGVRYRDAIFSADGERVLALSDASGELEWTSLPADGVGESRALTSGGSVLRFGGVPSPDGARLAYRDNDEDLWVLELATGRQTRVSGNREGVGEAAWSPDGRWLAFVQAARNTFRQIHLFDTRSGTTTAVTSDRVNSQSPAFDPGGRFLYFLSDRDLHSLVRGSWGPRQPEPHFDAPMRVYEMALQPGLRSRFQQPDELKPATDPGGGVPTGDAPEPPSETRVELEGLASRVRELEVPPGNYASLAAGRDALFFLATDAGRDGKTHLMAVKAAAEKPEPVRLVEDVEEYELSGAGGKLLVRREKELLVIDAAPKAPDKEALQKGRVDLSGWRFSIDPREDWRQIFVDAWRMERDYFYDPEMHGVDWEAVRDKYLPLVDRVTTREELSDLIGRVVGELSALHTSVRGGDHRKGSDEVVVASLGARLVRDEAAGGYRVDRLYRADPDYPAELAPLAATGVDVSEGDVVLAINGVPVLSVEDPAVLLRDQQKRQVRISVRPRAGGDSVERIVVPTDDEQSLRYSDWEYGRRRAVEEAGDGAIGYVHLRAMTGSDIDAWYRQYYPVFDRAGLIVDVRHNRGGNVDSLLLEKLLRRAWFYWKSRVGEPYWNMQYAFRGHMVVLVDQNTASDGEAYAEGFRRLGLGPVIGTRTWGGEIWLSGENRLSDGGVARAPMSGVYAPDGGWLIEQHGVVPDIEVDNLPHATFEGGDAQLDAAIAYLRGRIAEDPRPVPPPPPPPDRAFEYPR